MRKNGFSDISDRKHLQQKAFAMSSHYDSAIFNYFNTTEQLPVLKAVSIMA